MPAERAHPDLPGFKQGRQYFKQMVKRYQFCNKFIKGMDVLDVPVGTGFGASFLTGFKELCGLDISDDAIEYCRKHYPLIIAICGDMTKLSKIFSRMFDVVLCLEGYEHITKEQQISFLQEVKLVLKDPGIFIVTVPIFKADRKQNQFHLHEPTEEEFKKTISDHFETILFEKKKTPDGEVIYYVGK